MKRILLADDHSIVRAGLASIVRKYTPHEIVAEVGDGFKAIEQARILKPDLIIMDIGMPGLSGLEAVSQISQFLPSARIIILSIHRDKRFVTSAIRLGVAGYLVKEGAVEELVDAIEAIAGGKRYISPALSDIVADELVAPKGKEIRTEMEELTPREVQVLSLIARGRSRAEITKRLHISPETVKTHRKNIMEKLHIHTHSELVTFALKHNLGPVPEE